MLFKLQSQNAPPTQESRPTVSLKKLLLTSPVLAYVLSGALQEATTLPHPNLSSPELVIYTAAAGSFKSLRDMQGGIQDVGCCCLN